MRVAQQFENLCIARRLYLPRNRLPLPAERLCEPRMRHAEFASEGNDVETYRVRPYEIGRPSEEKRLPAQGRAESRTTRRLTLSGTTISRRGLRPSIICCSVAAARKPAPAKFGSTVAIGGRVCPHRSSSLSMPRTESRSGTTMPRSAHVSTTRSAVRSFAARTPVGEGSAASHDASCLRVRPPKTEP